MRATSFEDISRSPPPRPDGEAQRPGAADVIERAVDRLPVAQNDQRRPAELRPVGIPHRAAGEFDHRDVVLRDLPLVAVHPKRIADAAEIDELSADLLAASAASSVALSCAYAAPVTSTAAAQNALRTVRFNIVDASPYPNSIAELVTRIQPGSLQRAGQSRAYIIHGVRSAFLDNGLKILVQELHTAPLVSVWCWYRVGLGRRAAGPDRRVALGRAHEFQGHRATSPATR